MYHAIDGALDAAHCAALSVPLRELAVARCVGALAPTTATTRTCLTLWVRFINAAARNGKVHEMADASEAFSDWSSSSPMAMLHHGWVEMGYVRGGHASPRAAWCRSRARGRCVGALWYLDGGIVPHLAVALVCHWGVGWEERVAGAQHTYSWYC